jgi:hypothetical protein
MIKWLMRFSQSTPRPEGWSESTGPWWSPAVTDGGVEKIERDRDGLRERRSIRISWQWSRWFYRANRGWFRHFTAGNGRDAAAVTSMFLGTNPLAYTGGGPLLYRDEFLAVRWGPGEPYRQWGSEVDHGVLVSTMRPRLKTTHWWSDTATR